MKLDIILITYNQEQYIAQAVESILMQRVNDYVQVRVIVADDCSKDKTLEIIKSYEEKSPFPFVYLSVEKNMGHVRNYQRAFAACDGDFILVLEGDDYWCSPYHVSEHINFLFEHNECSMSVNGIILLWEDSKIFEFNPRENDEIIYVNIEQQILQNHIGNHSSACYRTNLVKTIPEKFYCNAFDDALLGIYFSQFGFIAKLKKYTTVYRKHSYGLWGGKASSYHQNELIRRLRVDDELFDYKFHSFFKNSLLRLTQPKKVSLNIKDFIPPIIIHILRFIVPTALIKILKKK